MAAKRPPARKALTAELRERRDKLIIDLFLLGHTQQSIATHPQVKLTSARVNQIIAAEMERSKEDQLLRNSNAMGIYLSRLEILIREAFSKVIDGDLKAIEVARRLMEQQGKIYGLADNVPSRNPIPPMSDNELDDDVDNLDELTKYRLQRKLPPPPAEEAQ